jgi:replication-associated recombination protein RarA
MRAGAASRCKLERLVPISDEDLSQLADRALVDADRGLGGRSPLVLELAARELLLLHSGGDARSLLNGLESASILADPATGAISGEVMEAALGRRMPGYEDAGEPGHQPPPRGEQLATILHDGLPRGRARSSRRERQRSSTSTG